MYFVKTFKNFLSDEECDDVLNFMSEKELEFAYYGSENDRQFNKEIRNSFITKIKLDGLQKKVAGLIDKELKFKGYNLENFEFFQFTKYEKDGHYSWHIDSNPINEHILCTIVVQLNNDYLGGELMYKDLDNYEVEFKRGKGNIFMFPSNIEHCVKPITKGIRYSLVSWVTLKKLPNNKTLI